MTTAFLESPRFPTGIRYGAVGGPEFATQIITVNSGNEQRAAVWSVSRGQWQIDYGPYDAATANALIAFFRSVKGRAIGFRFRDLSDYQDNGLGRLGATGLGTGLASYQLTKVYAAGALSDVRPIGKPVAGTVAVQRNGTPVAFGTSPGQLALDTTTGIVTFVPDAQGLVTGSVSTGATTSITFDAPVSTTVGDIVVLSGLVGTGASLLNGPQAVTARSGNTLTFAVNTTGLTAATTGGAKGARYPQPADTLTYTGQHDVPVRFDTDRLQVTAVDKGYFSVQGLTLIEIRT